MPGSISSSSASRPVVVTLVTDGAWRRVYPHIFTFSLGIPLFTGVLKNKHPPQHSTNDPTITQPETPPDDSLFEVPRFQRLNSFLMSRVGVSGGEAGGVLVGSCANTHPSSFPLYKGVSSNWVECWPFLRADRPKAEFAPCKLSVWTIHRLCFLRASCNNTFVLF